MYDTLPLVTFEYPHGDEKYLKRRYVRVTELNRTHLYGREFETANPAATDEGQPKTYLLAKIPQNGVALLEFTQD